MLGMTPFHDAGQGQQTEAPSQPHSDKSKQMILYSTFTMLADFAQL